MHCLQWRMALGTDERMISQWHARHHGMLYGIRTGLIDIHELIAPDTLLQLIKGMLT
jgi:hypothetical protein